MQTDNFLFATASVALAADREEREAERAKLKSFKDKVQRQLLGRASLSSLVPAESYQPLPAKPGLDCLQWLAPRLAGSKGKKGSQAGRRRRRVSSAGGGATVVMPDTLMFPGSPSKPFWLSTSPESGPPARKRLPRRWDRSFFVACCADLEFGTGEVGADAMTRFLEDAAPPGGGPGCEADTVWDGVVAVKKVAMWGQPQQSRVTALTARSLRTELRRDLTELDGCCLQRFVRGRGRRAVVYRVVWSRDRHTHAFSIVNQRCMPPTSGSSYGIDSHRRASDTGSQGDGGDGASFDGDSAGGGDGEGAKGGGDGDGGGGVGVGSGVGGRGGDRGGDGSKVIAFASDRVSSRLHTQFAWLDARCLAMIDPRAIFSAFV